MAPRRQLLGIEEIKGAWAILPTPSKPNASDWREADTVDLDETARAVEGLIAAGVDGILTFGTLGECATLNKEEKKKFLAAAVETARGRVPLFTGTTSLNTRDTIELTRNAHELGADGTMLGLPMWCELDVPGAVQFYRDVAEACPTTAICIYANPDAFKFSYPAPFWAQVSEIPQVVSSKHMSGGRLLIDLTSSQKRIRLMPIELEYYMASRIDPEFFTAFWSSAAVCGPILATRLRDEMVRAKSTNDWAKAKELNDAMGKASVSMFPRGDRREFGKYNIALEKARTDAAGWMKAGPCRPPYHVAPEPYLAGARQSGEKLADIARQLTATA